VVERILQCSGVNVNAKVQEVTPLFIACMNGDFNTIKLLLNAGADPTILCEKITRRFMDNKMKMKIHSSGKINDSSDRGMTALHQLCLWNLKRMEPEELLTVFSLLIRAGANIHQCTPEGFQPLHYAVRNPVLVRLLLDAGADANVTADDGTTALHKCSSLDSISLLIENGGANINKQIQTNGWTPLHNMVLVMDGENLVKFIEYGPDCNIADKYGNGALHTVLSRSIPFRPGPKPALISALLKAGADPALKNYSGETPLHVMLFDSQYSTEIMSLLLEAGADINAKDNNGYTLLYRTFQDPRSESRINSPAGPVLLLNHGASANVRDLRGRTILHETIKYPDYLSGDFTRSNPNATQLDFYLDLGLDLHAVDYHGNNLLHELAFRQNKYTINGFRSLLEKLVSLGLDPNKENYGGQTPLHIVAGDRRRLLILPSADGMPIDLVISVTKNINAIDNHGITPLHLAAAVSAYNVTKLLEAGADPTCSTHKGITPLHLAAWSRQSNIVGVLLEALHLKSHTSDVKSNISVDAYELPTPPRIWSHKRWSQPPIGIDVLDHRGLTPLAYACRSGRPETVALLLQAGADVNIEATIKACVQFDNEQELWCKSDKCFDAATEGINDLVNFILKDKSRPSIEASGASGPSNNMQPNTDTARLEEILDMLLENGTDMSHFGHNWWKLLRAESVSNGTGRYTLGLLLKARKLLLEDVQIGNNTSIPNMFAEHALRYHQLATDQALREFKHIRQGEANQDLVHSMLIQREYDMIEKLFHLGVDFLVADQLNGNSNLGIFVQHGFASLVEKIGNLEVAAKFKAGICHAAGDKTRPGLGFFTEGNSEYTTSKNGLPAPYLLQAVSRELPNMDVIHLLVEKFGVDVDELDCEWGNASRVYKKASLGSALIILAEGCFWWQVALAMPYLIDYSADLEIRNKMGQTPLHIALTETNAGPFHKEAARILIAAGADVNAVDINCCSCLAYAKNDIEMMRLLIANGARVNPDALFAAIDSKRVDVLELLLSAGADANMRRQRRKESLPNKKLTNGLEICASPNLQISLIAEDQWFPVHYAARQIRPDDDLFITTLDTRESIVHIVETLLSHGADPFAKFMKRLTHEWPNGDYLSVDQANDDEHTNGKSIQSAVSGMEMTEQSCNECDPGQMSAEYEECTVLHELLLEGNIVEPFLKLPHLDPNLHNAKGQTLFHAACRGRLGPDAPVNSVIGLQRDTNEISTSSLFSCLLSGGADIAACDNAGRNALHHMLWPIEQRYSRRAFIVSLKRLIELCPMLVNQHDSAGRTPLHMAVVYAVEYGNTRGAEALLDVAANPFVTDQNGDTILHILLRSLHNADLFKLLRKLLACGLNLNARNILGETPLFTFYGRKHVNKLDNAEREWSGEALTILETGHPNFVARDNRGRGLLHVAAKGDVRRFQELMGKGLDPMLEDNDGRTALDIAAACGNIEITRLFERENVE
jgi:ankyrin repeat protein